jgi:hypothetical protein
VLFLYKVQLAVCDSLAKARLALSLKRSNRRHRDTSAAITALAKKRTAAKRGIKKRKKV